MISTAAAASASLAVPAIGTSPTPRAAPSPAIVGHRLSLSPRCARSELPAFRSAGHRASRRAWDRCLSRDRAGHANQPPRVGVAPLGSIPCRTFRRVRCPSGNREPGPADTQFDTLSRRTGATLGDHLARANINFQYEKDLGGLLRTVQAGHGIQKVGGSTPPGSTTFLNSDLPAALSHLGHSYARMTLY